MKLEYTAFSEAKAQCTNLEALRVMAMPTCDRTLFVVCGRMDGPEMGDVAAAIVCDSVCKFWENNPEDAIPDVSCLEVQPGDRIFLCTDGVCRFAEQHVLTARLLGAKPLDDTAESIKSLCENSSATNYSGIIIDVGAQD